MRPGPARGHSVSIELTVTDGHAEQLVPGAPAVCTASALLSAIDEVTAQLLEPHLEHGEVATVVAIDVTRRLPLPVDTSVKVTATVASVSHTSLVCEVLVRRDSGAVAARGSIEHRVVDAAAYADEITAVATTTIS